MSADPAPAGPPLGDLLSRALDVGYRAFDDYVQHGQRIIQHAGDGTSSRDRVATDVQDLGARMMRHASDMLGTWIDLFGGPAPAPATNGPAAGATPETRPSAPPAGTAPSTSRRLRLRVAASRAVEVALELRDGPMPSGLVARELRATDAAAAPLAVTTDGATTVEVVVPDDHPVGVYDVLLLDAADDTPVGALRLTVR